MSLIRAFKPKRPRRLFLGLGISLAVLLIALGVFASNGWLPRTDPITGKKFGWFGKELPRNAASSWNPFAAPLPGGTPQLSKEYIYAGGRLLAVEDANAGGATPTPTPYGFEGDVAPRNLGDGTVDSTDVTQERRFVTGLDTPDPNTNEFQRADAAPFATLGDAAIDSSDVIQVRRYTTGLDPMTPAGGPTGQGNAPESLIENNGQKAEKSIVGSQIEAAANRELRVMPATGRRGETVTVPIQMKLERDEVAVAFTLEYDDSRLTNPRVTLGSGLPSSAYLTTNTTQPGKIGILVDAEEPFSSTPRTIRIVYITFDIRTAALTGISPLGLTSSLARQGVADRTAHLVVTSYVSGSISVIQ